MNQQTTPSDTRLLNNVEDAKAVSQNRHKSLGDLMQEQFADRKRTKSTRTEAATAIKKHPWNR